MNFPQKKDYILKDIICGITILLLTIIIKINNYDMYYTGKKRVYFYVLALTAALILLIKPFRSKLSIIDDSIVFTDGFMPLRRIPFQVISYLEYKNHLRIIIHLPRNKKVIIRYSYENFDGFLDILKEKGVNLQKKY